VQRPPPANATPLAAGNAAGGGQQDPVLATELPFRTEQDRRLPKALSWRRDRGFLGASNLGRHGMNRLPANQKHRPHATRWIRCEKPQPGHRLPPPASRAWREDPVRTPCRKDARRSVTQVVRPYSSVPSPLGLLVACIRRTRTRSRSAAPGWQGATTA